MINNINTMNPQTRMDYLYSVAHKFGNDDVGGAFRVSERLLETADALLDGEVIGMEIRLEDDGKSIKALNYIFTNHEDSISREDYSWMFKEFARINPDKSIAADNSFLENRICYELIQCKDYVDFYDREDAKERALFQELLPHGPYFHELCEEMSKEDARIRVLIGKTESRKQDKGKKAGEQDGIFRRILISLPKPASLRLRTLFSLVFLDTQLKEEGSVQKKERMTYYLTQRSAIRALGFLTIRPIEKKALQDSESEIPDELFDLDRVRIDLEEDPEEEFEDDLDDELYDDEEDEPDEKPNAFSKETQKNESQAKPDYRQMLEELIGLHAAKEQVKCIAAFARMQKAMKEQGKAPLPLALNMEFAGNPGTAKTTVARIMAGIFHEIGLVSDGKPVEVGRADLIGEYVGQTAPKVQGVFNRAKGRVLFIDEAYSLVEERNGCYGDEAINTIVQEIENRRDETIVIFAGYPDKMKELFAKNPGLRSRVPFRIHFEDYSADELYRICEMEAKKRGFCIAPEAEKKMREICALATENPELGNGRFCRNLVEKSVLKFASRLFGDDAKAALGKESESGDDAKAADMDYTLTAEDIASFELAKEKKAQPIGFVA